MRKRIITIAAAAVALSVLAVVGLSASVHAAPAKAPNAGTVSADCGDDGSLQVIVNFSNNGQWTPGFVTGTNQVFHPTAFGPSVGTFTDPAGNDFPISDPGGAKANSPQNGAHVLNCTYHIDVSLAKGGHLLVDGTVTGYVTPPSP